jgi:diguanylate cyclase (GGDEF)-like protein
MNPLTPVDMPDPLACPRAGTVPISAAAAAPRRWLRALAGWLVAVSAGIGPAQALDRVEWQRVVHESEAKLVGFPRQVAATLDGLAPETETLGLAQRRQFRTLHGEALVLANRTPEGLQVAAQLDVDGIENRDDAMRAGALLIRSAVQAWAGDSVRASALAEHAHELASNSDDLMIRHKAALAAGMSARALGRLDAAFKYLEEARTLAEAADNPYRRSCALYQLSTLNLAVKQPQKALADAEEAFRQGTLARSVFAMARAKMGESAALDGLDKRRLELSAMLEALAIARNGHSQVAEALALINLADLNLRRKSFREAHDLSRRSLELSQNIGDASFVAVSKLNLGLALLSLGRIDAGKRLAEDAILEYERTGASGEIAETLREYGTYLEAAGDYKGALALFQRERKLNEEIARAMREKAVVELQGKYEADRRQRAYDLMYRENELQAEKLRNRELQQYLWWLLAAGFAISFCVVAVLYRKLHVSNRLLAQKNDALSQQNSRDPLTSLYNRRHFQHYIDERANRDERRRPADDFTQALLLIDIDHFKQINDRYGHAAGDAVLVEIAHRLRETLRETDMIVRWGGEEFLVFVPAAPRDRIDEIVLRILNAVTTEPVDHQGQRIRVTASIGYAPMPLPPDELVLGWDGAISLVDKALYMAKANGRNRAYGIGGMHAAAADAKGELEGDLEAAWRQGVVDLRVLVGAQAVTAVPAGLSTH